MFNKDFYPTPQAVIQKMIGADDITGKFCLEPSAGKGDIVSYLNKYNAKVSYCEIEPKLAKMITGAKFLKTDFLTVESSEVSHVDFIYMNPPFSNDDKHILHAWEIAPARCVITALCNWQTINNTFSRTRAQLKRIITNHGTSENLGEVFSSAERSTNVEVGLIRLYKPSQNEDDWSDYFDENEEQEEQANGIIGYNAVRECVNRYVGACKLYRQVADNAVAMNDMIGVFGAKSVTFQITQDQKDVAVEDFDTELRKVAWGWIFSKMNMAKYMTSKLKEEINKFIEKQKQVPFTMTNVYKMIDMVVQTHGQRIERAIVEVFENYTENYHENRFGKEGWKTNSHRMINKKIIVPYIGEQSRYSNYPSVGYGSRYYEMLVDFQKCLCTIAGVDFDTIPSLHYGFFSSEYLDENGKKVREYKDWGVWYDWGFFEIKIFKKGTLHMKFKDDRIWMEFNKRYAEIKGYPLPEKV